MIFVLRRRNFIFVKLIPLVHTARYEIFNNIVVESHSWYTHYRYVYTTNSCLYFAFIFNMIFFFLLQNKILIHQNIEISDIVIYSFIRNVFPSFSIQYENFQFPKKMVMSHKTILGSKKIDAIRGACRWRRHTSKHFYFEVSRFIE